VNFLRVDPRNDEEFQAWFGVLHRAELDRDQGRDEGWLPQEWHARATDEMAPNYHQLFALGDENGFVAVAALEISRDDNLTWIRGDLFVDPPRRHQGYGTEMLTHLEATARELGRTSLLFWVVEDAWERGSGPNRAFAPRRGYEVIEENIVREIEWPRPDGELDRLFESWTPKATGYDILYWRDATPQDLLKARAKLMASMREEMPNSGYGSEPEHWDEHRVRLHEQRANNMGRDLLVAVARDRTSGEVVGFSELTVSRERPETAYQWDTLVVRAHRGQSLGGLLKITTMRLLADGKYQTKKIVTSNNALNTAMIAVNDSLGAHPTGGIVTWRKVLTD
jgi:GNAT superfamily N-acetyltransferase/RimJ/RimL family protein N-acetyltransferase